ncbi:MAG TPA: hypothetical protein VIB48_21935 [Acidimicrobiia bacterium]
MGERLRMVPEVRVRRGIHLLGVEAERRRELDERAEALDRLGHPSGGGDRLGRSDFEAVLDPAPGRCCVRLRATGAVNEPR